MYGSFMVINMVIYAEMDRKFESWAEEKGIDWLYWRCTSLNIETQLSRIQMWLDIV